MYSLDSGLPIHKFVHGLPQDCDVYPQVCIFLPTGFAFCGATMDGKVTFWDVKQGDELQSVSHPHVSIHPCLLALVLIFHKRVPPYMPSQYVLPLLLTHAFPHEPIPLQVHMEEKSGIMLLATASRDEVRVWYAIPAKYDGIRSAWVCNTSWSTIVTLIWHSQLLPLQLQYVPLEFCSHGSSRQGSRRSSEDGEEQGEELRTRSLQLEVE